jgi:hypothetical protein
MKKSIYRRFWVLFRGWVGRYLVLGQAGRNCFGRHPPKKAFFSFIRRFWDCFWRRIQVARGAKKARGGDTLSSDVAL